jgi:hypothetical protein
MAVSGCVVAGHPPRTPVKRLPDSKIGLAETRSELADFEITA